MTARKAWAAVAAKSAAKRPRTVSERSNAVRRPSAHPQIVLDPFLGFCRVAGVPVPVPEYRFAPPRRWRFDYAWPEQKIALEVEGGVWTGGRHTRAAGFLGDMEKYNAAALAGWRVLRTTPQGLQAMLVPLKRVVSAN